jgi:hypothetical protein
MARKPDSPPLVTLHAGQRAVYDATHRFKVVACGRRWGKTELGKALIAQAVQEGKWAWWLAPTYKMSAHVWRDLRYLLRAHDPKLSIAQADRRIELSGGGGLEVRSTHNPDLLRGAGLDYVVMDEAAFMPDDVWAQVVRPMLMTTQGSALFISSPHGTNWFWRAFQLGQDPAEPAWGAFHYTSQDNPLIPAEEFAAIQRTTPERVWREEYLAEFLTDEGQVFRRMREVATAPLSPAYDPTHRYIMGVDWGRKNDYTVLIVLDASTQTMVAFDRFHEVEWQIQRDRLHALASAWHVALIYAEENSIGSVNIEALQAEGLPVRPFVTTQKSKSALIQSLSLAIERGELRLQAIDVLLNELTAYNMARTPNGYRYGAPAGGHDDAVMALGLAWWGVADAHMPLLGFL